MGLAEDIHDRVGRCLLPPYIPLKIEVSLGNGQPCSACNQPIPRRARVLPALDDAGIFRFHLDCLGLWMADLRKRRCLAPTPVEAR